MYKILGEGKGIPKMHWVGIEGDYNIMVMDLLGTSFDQLPKSACNRESLIINLFLADQMVTNTKIL